MSQNEYIKLNFSVHHGTTNAMADCARNMK